MVYEKNGYQLGKKSQYWFYKHGIPDDVEPINELPEGYTLVEGKNHYPFLKRIK